MWGHWTANGEGCQTAIVKMSDAVVCDGVERSRYTVMQEGRWSLYTIMGMGKGGDETVVDMRVNAAKTSAKGLSGMMRIQSMSISLNS